MSTTRTWAATNRRTPFRDVGISGSDQLEDEQSDRGGRTDRSEDALEGVEPRTCEALAQSHSVPLRQAEIICAADAEMNGPIAARPTRHLAATIFQSWSPSVWVKSQATPKKKPRMREAKAHHSPASSTSMRLSERGFTHGPSFLLGLTPRRRCGGP